MLDTNAVQEQLSLAHVRAVAAICRFSVEHRGLAEIRIEPPFCPSGVEGLLELSEFAEGKRPSTSLGETGDGQFAISINPHRAVDRDGVDLSIHAKGLLVPNAELRRISLGESLVVEGSSRGD